MGIAKVFFLPTLRNACENTLHDGSSQQIAFIFDRGERHCRKRRLKYRNVQRNVEVERVTWSGPAIRSTGPSGMANGPLAKCEMSEMASKSISRATVYRKDATKIKTNAPTWMRGSELEVGDRSANGAGYGSLVSKHEAVRPWRSLR
jgi:hypothetical protein